MELKNLRIFVIAQGAMVLLLVGIAFFTATNLTQLLAITIELTSIQEVVQAAENINSVLEEERLAIGQYPLTGSQDILTKIEDGQLEYDQNWDVIVINRGSEQPQLIAEIEDARLTYQGYLDEVISEYQSNPSNNTSADKLRDAINYKLLNLDPKFSDLSEPEMENLARQVVIEKTRASTLSIVSNIALGFSIVVGIVVVVLVGVAIFFSQRMIKSMYDIVNAANAISRGDMDVLIDVDQGGEIGDLAQAIDRMRTSLRAAIERLRRSM